LVIARFQRDVHRCATRSLTGRFQRDDFRVVTPIVLVKSFSNDFSLADDHTANHGIWTCEATPLARKRQGVLHEANGVFVHDLIEKGVCVRFRVEGNQVVNLFAGAYKADRQS
jgi:hypothetical protein